MLKEEVSPLDIVKEFSAHEKLLVKALKLYLRLRGLKTLHPDPVVSEKGENHKIFRQQSQTYKENEETVYRKLESFDQLHDSMENVKIVPDILICNVEKNPNLPFLGKREILSEESVVVENSDKPIIKFGLGDYVWTTYAQAKHKIDCLSLEFMSHNFDKNKMMALFADTSQEWFMCAFSLFQISSPVVTVYSTLSNEGIIHALSITEAEGVLVDRKSKTRLLAMLPELPFIKYIFCSSGCKIDIGEITPDLADNLKIVELDKIDYQVGRVKENGKNIADVMPVPHDTAFIMFTSGSSGLPKGVVITHQNIVSSVSSLYHQREYWTKQVYCAYLPEAHILEFIAECAVVLFGGSLGFGTPLTLFDNSPMLKEGHQGDLTVLKPTCFATVPLLLERVKKTAIEKIKASSRVKQILFQTAYNIKLDFLKAGRECQVLDKLVFRKLKTIFGGRLSWAYVGGASLQRETEQFFNVCFGVFKQGYGLTETCCSGALSNLDYWRSDNVGPPTACIDLKLCNWDEGGYHVTDPDGPRGEIVISGKCVSSGYYKCPELTEESFVKDPNTEKIWFYTGDIGQMLPDGTLRIIDRKKDIVKLKHGEYTSLVRVEKVFMKSNLVDNVCVAPNSTSDFLVALIVANLDAISKIALSQNINPNGVCLTDLLRNQKIVEEATKTVNGLVDSTKILGKFEKPGRICFLSEVWTPDTNLTTPSMKLRRAAIAARYKDLLL